MAKYSNTVEYNIRTTLDNTGIAKLQAELTQLQNHVTQLGAKELMPASQVSDTLAKIKKIQTALTQAFNPKLGMLNTSAFMKNLSSMKMSMSDVYKTFSAIGPEGQRAFTSMYGQIAKIDTGLRSMSKTTDKIMNTLGNTVRWGLIASGFASVMRAVHGAAQYVSDLDKSLTNIQMVTASARDTMNDFAVEANKVAQRLGGTTVQMTNATEVFIRQGYDLATSTQLGEYAVHLANVSGQDSAMASDEITAYMNAFKIPLDDLGNAVSKWAAVANNAAVSVEELSVASQKAAAVATTVGVDMDQFAAHIAAIEATTREAPENIGNGLKTIYSRIADVKLGETLEDGVDLGSFAKAIEKVGVQVLDTTGNLRDAGDILEDLMVVWQDLDQTQRAAVAKTVAGRFQLARFEALMNSADIYEKSLKTSQAETGTITYDRMQETYRESLEGRTKALQASVEEIFLNLFTTDTFYPAIDALQGLVDTINDLIEATGGGQTALMGLAAIMTKLASNSLSRGISNFIVNRQADAAAQQNIQQAQSMARAQLMGQGLVTNNGRINAFANDVAGINQYAGIMNAEQIRQANALTEQRIEAENRLNAIEQERAQTEKVLRTAVASVNEATEQSVRSLIADINALEADGEQVSLVSEKFGQLKNLVSSTARVFTSLSESIQTGNFKNIETQVERVSVGLEKMAEAGLFAEHELRMVGKTQEILTQIARKEITNQEQLTAALEKTGITLTEFTLALQKAPKATEQAIASYERLKSEVAAAGETASLVRGQFQQMQHGLAIQNITNQVIGLTQSLMSAVFVAQSLGNLEEIWSNKETDPFEKMKLSAMDFAMVLALGIPMINQGRQAVAGLREALALSAAQQQIDNILKQQGAIVTEEKAVADLHEQQALMRTALINEAVATSDETRVIAIRGVCDAIMIESAETNRLNIVKLQEIAIENGVSVAEVREIATKMGVNVATQSLTVSTLKYIAAQAAAHPIITAVVIALGLLAIALKIAYDQYHAFDVAVEKAAKTLDQANTRFQNATQELANVKDALDKIKSSDDTFDKLTAGTIEWTEALYAANQQVLDLVEKYPELAQYITTGKHGQMTLNEKGQERASQLAQQDLATAQVQQLLAKQNYIAAKDNQTALNAARAEFANIINQNTSVETYGTGEGTYTQVITDNQAIADQMKQLATDYQEAVNSGNKELVDEFIESNNLTPQQIAALENVIQALNQNTMALQASNDATAAAILSSEKAYTDADEVAQTVMRNTLSERREALQSEINNGWADQQMAKEGLTWDSGTLQDWAVKNNIFGEGVTYSNNKWYKDGKEYQELNDSKDQYEQIRAAYVAKALEEALAAEAPNIAKSISELSKDQQQALLDFQQNKTMMINGEEQKFADYLSSQGITSIDQFISALNDGSIALENFADATNPMIDSHSLSDLEYDYEKTSMMGQDQEYHDKQIESMTAEEAKKWDLEVEDVVDQAEILQDVLESVDENFELTEGRARALAIQNQRMVKGLDTLADKWEDWSDILNDTDKTTVDYIDTIQDLTKVISDLVGAEEDLDLSKEFFESAENMEYLERAAEGDIDAVNRLGVAVAQDLISQLEPLKEFSGLDFSDADTEQAWSNMVNSFNTNKDIVISGLEELQNNLDNIGFGENVYDQLGGEEWVNALNEMAMATGMSVDQMNALLNSMGVQADVTVVHQPTQMEVPEYTTEETVTQIGGGEEDGEGNKSPKTYRKTSHTYISGYKTVDGFVDVAQINTGDAAGTPPSINYVGNGGGHSGGGGKKGGGGGGGGGGSKGKKIEKAEAKTAEIDPYQKVNAELDKLADGYTEVNKAKDRMYGDRYRRASEQEIKNLQAQNDKLEERIKISEKLIEAYRTGQDNPEYGIYLNGESLGKYGLTDDDLDGIIDNRWERIEQLALDYQNKLAAANALAGEDRSEAEQEEHERLQKIADEAYDLWNGAQGFIDEYEGTFDKLRDDTEQVKENTYQIEDTVIDIWNYAKDAAKELGEFREEQVDLAETLATLWGDDAVKSLGFAFDRFTNMFEANEKALADAIADYEKRLNKATDEEMKKWYQDQLDLANKAMENGTSVLDLNMQRMQQIFKAVDEWNETGKSKLFGSNEKAMWEAFDEAWKDAVDYASKLKDYIEDIHSNIQDVMDDMYEAMDDRKNLFDQVKDQYEYLADMTELIYGEKAYGMQETIARKQAQTGEEYLHTLENQRRVNHDMLEELDKSSEEYKKALEKEQELDKEILDTRKDIADTYKQAKEYANDLAIQNWLDNFTADVNGVQVPLEYAADAWERIKENADNYLDDLNRAWELEKLENEYLKLIDEAIDPNLQRQITEQMEQQLEYLREKDKLSRYDVNYANAQLEILQKTIALEDARANKNQMKLRRDSQGNYSYVYAANKNDVRDKENDLLDARMNGYNMSVEASTDATDRYLQKVQSMADALRDVANDQSLSQEQIEAITQSIIEDGYQFLDAMGEQLTTAQRNGIESYIQAAQELSELNAGNVLDISQQLEEGLIDDLGMVTDVFNAAVLEWVDGETGLSYFRDSANQAGEDIVRNVGDFVAAVGAANANIQTPLNDIQGGLTKTNQAMSDLTSSAKEFYNFLEDKSGVVQRAAQDLAYYQNKLTDMGDEMNAYYTEWNKRGKELESEKAINSQLNIDIDSLKKEKEQLEKQLEEAVKGSNKGGGSGNKGNYSDSDIAWGIAQNIWTYGSWGNDPYRHSRITERYGEAIADLTQRYINDYWATGQLVNWDSDIWGYATGGYTGSWTDNENGRIALLHQKELVLNEEDTENMLAAISIVRDLVDKIKGSSFKDTINSFTNNSSDFVGNNIEQRVEIKAEFPGVRSAADIENALINLSNKAYQYAYNQNEKFI